MGRNIDIFSILRPMVDQIMREVDSRIDRAIDRYHRNREQGHHVSFQVEHKADYLEAFRTPEPRQYIGLIDNTGFTALHRDDTLSSHPGWCEFLGYEPLSRPEANSTLTISEVGTIKGIFVTSDNTKGGTCGELQRLSLFAQSKPVIPGDTYDIGSLLLESSLHV